MNRIATVLLFFTFSVISLWSQSNNGDCITAQRICKLGQYNYNSVIGFGKNAETLDDTRIAGSIIDESNAIWLYWDIAEAGEFKFEIAPYDYEDDIDFVLYQASNDKCESLQKIRAVMSGPNLPSLKNSNPCLGATGLSYKSTDVYENSGCSGEDDNYVSAVNGDNSTRYYLLINNYASEKGFSFNLNGSITLNESACENKSVSIIYEDMTLYPNPTANILNVDIGNSINDISDLLILDVTGRVISNVEITGQRVYQIDVSEVPQGMYTVRASGDEEVIEKRFVKI